MNRRSILRLLGLAPIAAPAAVAAASAPPLAPIDYSALAGEVKGRLDCNGFDFDGVTLSVPSLRRIEPPLDAISWMNAHCAVMPDGRQVMIAPDGRAWETCRPV